VPGKIQEFLQELVHACALSEKIQGLACVSAFSSKKNRTSLSHLHLILEFFKV
jgi:hypothetical protein